MFLHPLIAIFMAFWFSIVIIAMVDGLRSPTGQGVWHLVPVAMFFFGIALCLGGFIPEAIKAKRLLMSGIAKSGA